MKAIDKESDLFAPVKEYLEGFGFEVYAEVKGCDITAQKDDIILIVELKLKLNMELILQAVDRLDLCENVYIAIPQASSRSFPKDWKRIRRLLVRLGLGLLLVRERSSGLSVETVLEPGAPTPRKKRKKAAGILKEMELRQTKTNTGGVNRTKLMTAYREQALITAYILNKKGPASPKAVRENGGPKKAGSILYANFYGWFIHEEKACYAISAKGEQALKEYEDVIKKIKP